MFTDVRELAKLFLRDEVNKAGVGGTKLLFQTDSQLEAESRVSVTIKILCILN